MFNASRTYWKKTPKLTSAKENLKRWLLIDFVFCHLKRTSFKASWLIMRKLTGVLYNLYTLTNKWVIFQTCFFNSIDVIFFTKNIFNVCNISQFNHFCSSYMYNHTPIFYLIWIKVFILWSTETLWRQSFWLWWFSTVSDKSITGSLWHSLSLLSLYLSRALSVFLIFKFLYV